MLLDCWVQAKFWSTFFVFINKILKILFPIIILFLIYSCQKVDSEKDLNYSGHNCIDNNQLFIPEIFNEYDEYEFSFMNNTILNINTSDDKITNVYFIDQIGKTAFSYTYSYNEDPLITDDSLEESIFFEIDNNITKFIISDDNLRKAKVIYGKNCFCSNAGFQIVENGCIKGEKIDDEWQIDINILLDDDFNSSKMLSERFKLTTKYPAPNQANG